jgi:hypothetical protein
VRTEKIKLNPVSAQYAQHILADHLDVHAKERRGPNMTIPMVSVYVDGYAFLDKPHNAAATVLIRVANEAGPIDFILPGDTLEHLIAHFMTERNNHNPSSWEVFTQFARYVVTVGQVKMIFWNRTSHVLVPASPREITEGMVSIVVD